MELSLNCGMRLCLRQRLKMDLRQELKLEFKLAPPDNWSFKEPNPIKEIEEYKGKQVIRITKSELLSFADAAKRTREIIEDVSPIILFISMRGALPLFRCAMYAKLPATIGGGNWEKKKFNADNIHTFSAVKLYSSYFIDGLGEVVGDILEKTFNTIRGKRPIKTVFLDTSVTGTKLSWFMPQFIDVLKQVAEQLGRSIDLTSIILHHSMSGVFAVQPQEVHSKVTATRYDIGVKSLIAEDNPTLLGVVYNNEKIKCSDEAVGEVSAYEPLVNAGILIVDSNIAYFHHSTADLFVRIVGDTIRDSLSGYNVR